MAVYVYSITAAAHPRHLEGLTGVGEPPSILRSVCAGPLCAIVSDAPAELRPKRRDLTAHQNVQQRLMTEGTVLPLRFGLTAPDDSAVQAALEERGEEYTQQLTALEGCTEYLVKAAIDEDALLRQILLETPEARRLNEEIIGGHSSPDLPLALGEMVAREVQSRHDALAMAITEALRPHARDELSSGPTGEDFLSVSFLVDQEHEQRFLTAEKGIAGRLGDDVDVRLYGPLPAYSFV